jgi:transposase
MSAERCQTPTASGEPCKNSALPGSTACSIHSRGTFTHVGRPSKLTAELTDEFVRMLRAGNYIGVACHAVRINRTTFSAWIRRGASGRPEDEAFREFRERVEQARAEGEVRNVAQIARAASESWQAAAWLLERQYPERWGRPSSPQRQEAEDADVATAADDDPFREVDELAERRRSRSR